MRIPNCFHSTLILISVLTLASSCGPTIDVHKDVSEDAAYNSQTDVAFDNTLLKIVVFDVGEGDATLVISPEGEAALIDTGPPGIWGSKIEPYLSANRGVNLKYLLISHGDGDHNGGISEVGLAPLEIDVGGTLELSGLVELSILAKDCKFAGGDSVPCDADDDNAHSSVILLTYGSFKYLTTGDLPGGGGNPPYETIDLESEVAKLVGDIDILHVGHHGSNTSTNQALLSAATPEAAVISVGNDNDYWHPHPSVVERLIDAGVAVYQTGRGWLKDEFMDDVHVADGDIVIESDGVSYRIY